MRAVIQRASSADVRVGGEIVGRLDGTGLVVLLGVTHGDDAATAARMADKTWGLRIFTDPGATAEVSAADLHLPVLVVSQFTLYADTRKGRRPSWLAAAPGEVSEPLVRAYVDALRLLGAHVETGQFGADMAVSLINDGPMTIVLDSADWTRPSARA